MSRYRWGWENLCEICCFSDSKDTYVVLNGFALMQWAPKYIDSRSEAAAAAIPRDRANSSGAPPKANTQEKSIQNQDFISWHDCVLI